MDDSTKPHRYDQATGGWASLDRIARVEKTSKVKPAVLQTLAEQNKPGGYMCSSCAWAKPPKPHIAEFCENGAEATIWDLTSQRCTPEFFAEHSVSELLDWEDHYLEKAGRLTEPLRYDAASDRYVRAGWDEAFQVNGDSLKRLEPKDVTFYMSGKAAHGRPWSAPSVP
jgi:anaerobic selenocysteine-containing dehydrogenase